MSKNMFLFSGQGSQYVGMAKELCERYPAVDRVFELANDVLGTDIRKTAFEAIDELNITNDNRGLIFAAVSGTFLDLYRAVTAKVSGRSMDDVISDFSYKQQFVVKNAFRDSSRMSLSRLRKSVQILRDTAVQFNSSPGDPRVILEQAVTKMFMTKN